MQTSSSQREVGGKWAWVVLTSNGRWLAGGNSAADVPRTIWNNPQRPLGHNGSAGPFSFFLSFIWLCLHFLVRLILFSFSHFAFLAATTLNFIYFSYMHGDIFICFMTTRSLSQATVRSPTHLGFLSRPYGNWGCAAAGGKGPFSKRGRAHNAFGAVLHFKDL